MEIISVGPKLDRRPLTVQLYDRLYDAAVAGRPGDALPPELELSESLGVSRATVRQALALLEEDGIIRRGAGRRREVAPRGAGRHGTQPVERLIGDGIVVHAIHRGVTDASRWTAGLLGVRPGEPVAVWKSVLELEGRAVATALEFTHTTAEAELSPADTGGTLLAALSAGFRSRATPTLLRVAATSEDAADPDFPTIGSPVTVLSQALRDQSRSYVGKHRLRMDLVSLTFADDHSE